jgi:hypothetical protein
MWRRRMTSWLLVVLLVVAAGPSCVLSPDWTVTGSWSYRSGKFAYWFLELEQRGDTITGIACYGDGGALYRNVPVSGQFPRFTGKVMPEHFAQPWMTGTGPQIEGEAVSRDAIGVSLLYDAGHRFGIGFTRDDAARCP